MLLCDKVVDGNGMDVVDGTSLRRKPAFHFCLCVLSLYCFKKNKKQNKTQAAASLLKKKERKKEKKLRSWHPKPSMVTLTC